MISLRSMASATVVTCLAGVALNAPAALAAPDNSASSASAHARFDRQPRPTPGAGRALNNRAASTTDLGRIAGKNRFLTAVEISKAHFETPTWPDGAPVDVVTVASGVNYPDALAGGPFAAGLGPLLLVPQTGPIPEAVKGEISRLSPQHIAILGGPGAVAVDVEKQLTALGADTERFAGTNRYDTAAQVAVATAKALEGTDTVVLSSGEDFADALAGGASAAHRGGVLLLTRSGTLSPEASAALAQIAPSKVQVLGGEAVVSRAVFDAVKAKLPNATVERVAGANRSATAAALSKVTFPATTEDTFLANEADYPDALAAAPLAWFRNASLLVSRTACAPAATVAEDARLGAQFRTAIGGTGAVSDSALGLAPC